MRRLLPLLFLLVSSGAIAAPQPFFFTEETPAQDLVAHTLHLPDRDGLHTLESALASDGWQPLQQGNLGYIAYPVWSRVTLHNQGSQTRQILLYKHRPGILQLDVTLQRISGEREHLALGITRPFDNQPLRHRLMTVPVAIAPGETVTVYSRIRATGPTEASWQFSHIGDFSFHSTLEHLLWGIFFGAVLSMILYNLMLWFSLRLPMLLAYVAFGVLLVLAITNAQGFYRIFDFGLPQLWFQQVSWIFTALVNGAMILFAMLFFTTRQRMPRLHRWLQAMLLITAATLLAFVAALFDNSIYRHSPLLHLVYMATYLSLIAVAVVAMRRRITGATYYLLGQGSIFAATVLLLLTMSGAIGPASMANFLFPVGALLDLAFLAKAITQRVGVLKRELDLQRETTLAQSRFASLGKTLGMITHQWRTPLARQGAILTELELLLQRPDPTTALERLRQTLLPRLQQSVALLNNTVSDFRTFFAADNQTQPYQPARIIDQTLALIRWQELPTPIQLTWQPPTESPTLHGHPASLAHVLMILFENALDILNEREVPDPQLRITLTPCHQGVEIVICDNGGGITIEPLERIFNTFVSSKQRDSCGMGLYIARMLTEEVMGGTIRAENGPKGACFTLRLPESKA